MFLKALDKFRSWAALAVFLVGVGAVAWMTSMLARATEWLDQYGPLGWWFAVIIAVTLLAVAFLAVATAMAAWQKRQALKQWRTRTSDFNPLAPSFHLARLPVQELANPITRSIENKTLTDCELVGPANLVLEGVCNFSKTNFHQCDMILARTDVPIFNAFLVKNLDMVRGRVMRCTIFAAGDAFDAMMGIPGAVSCALTGNEDYDKRKKPK